MYIENLKKIRKELGLSVEQLAIKIDIPSRTIGGYERNERKMSLEIVTQLCKKLNVNANWFVTGQGEMFLNTYSTIGERIASVRDKSNITNTQMATILNISESEFLDIATNKKLPDLNFLNTLKQNFKVSIDWVLYGE